MQIAKVIRPSEFAGVNSLGHFARKIDGRNLVMFRDFFVIRDDSWDLSTVDLVDLPWVDEMQQNDIHGRVGQTRLSNDSLHAAYLLDIREAIRVVIHGRLFKQQVDGTATQDVSLKAECTRRGTERRNSRVDKVEFRFRKTPLQVAANLIPPPRRRCDGTSQERDTPFLVTLELGSAILQSAAQLEIIVSVASPPG